MLFWGTISERCWSFDLEMVISELACVKATQRAGRSETHVLWRHYVDMQSMTIALAFRLLLMVQIPSKYLL